MTKEQAETTPLIELAEMLVDYSEDYEGQDPQEIVDGLDRYDAIQELERCDAFDE